MASDRAECDRHPEGLAAVYNQDMKKTEDSDTYPHMMPSPLFRDFGVWGLPSEREREKEEVADFIAYAPESIRLNLAIFRQRDSNEHTMAYRVYC